MLAPGAARLVGPVAAVLVALLAAVVVGALPAGPAVGLGVAGVGGGLGFLLVFFRDPDRRPGDGVVSAADGRVRAIDRLGDAWRVSVFMNVTDVHVNRVPWEGELASIEAGGAGFRAAFRPDAERNVHRRYRFATSIGPVDVVQITGVVARRLVSFLHVGAIGRKGDRLGMIVLGSRVDVLVPADRCSVAVTVGERVWAGRSTIARVRP